MFQAEHLQEKWSPVLEHPDLPQIEDAYKRSVTTVILENQEKALREKMRLSSRRVCPQVTPLVFRIGTRS